MNPRALRGSLVALITPFDEALNIDQNAYLELLDWHLGSGSSGLVIAGTTGESAQLSEHEFQKLLEIAVKRVGGRLPLIAGTGTASTAKSVQLTRLAQSIGVDAALVVTPYYVRPPQEGLLRHYQAVADVGLPIILYNVPSRTGVDLLPSTVELLSMHPEIIGIKEAKSDLERIRALLAIKSERPFLVLSGDDDSAAEAVMMGADGVISVIANVLPDLFAALMNGAANKDPKTAERSRALRPLLALLGVEPNPIPVKWALKELRRCEAYLRLPLLPLNVIHRPAIRAALAALNRLPTPLIPEISR